MPPGEDQLAPVRQPPEEQRPLLRFKAQQADEILTAAGAVLLQIGPDDVQMVIGVRHRPGGVVPGAHPHQPARLPQFQKVLPGSAFGHAQPLHDRFAGQPALLLGLSHQKLGPIPLTDPGVEVPQVHMLQAAPDQRRAGDGGQPGEVHGPPGGGCGKDPRLRGVLAAVPSVQQQPPQGVVIGGEDKTSAISQSAGTLTIGGEKYLVAEDAKITLVTLGALDKKNKVDASVMNKDKDADYEVSANMTASGLIDALKGYTYTYDFGGKLTENAASNGNTIKELYVTITYAESTSTPGTPSTPTQQNLIDSFTVNGKAYTIAGAYDTVKAAVENATKVQMADAAIADYEFVATTKQVDTNGEVVTTGGTHAYGTYGIFGTKDAALTFTAPAKFTDNLNGQTITDANASAGDYIVLATENHGTVTYYAYYLAK